MTVMPTTIARPTFTLQERVASIDAGLRATRRLLRRGSLEERELARLAADDLLEKRYRLTAGARRAR